MIEKPVTINRLCQTVKEELEKYKTKKVTDVLNSNVAIATMESHNEIVLENSGVSENSETGMVFTSPSKVSSFFSIVVSGFCRSRMVSCL